jgi:hypothetical protein
MSNHLKNELHNIISGKSQVSHGAAIQAITGYLNRSSRAGFETKKTKQIREEETKNLIEYISEHQFWLTDIDFTQYVSEGAEQRVYLNDSEHVLKLNDSIYYSCWTDYFHNLLLHNHFFPDTAYELLGFTKENEILYAVVKQPFVTITQETDLNKVKLFLETNGFFNNRNNDYINYDLGIILEDLHDENVLTKNGIHYFIDTVFYLTKDFWT